MDNHNDIALAGGHRRGNMGRSLSYTVLFTQCLILSILTITCLPGCSPKFIEKVVYQKDTTVVHKRDSIVRRDSIYVKEWMKGDTVFIEKYKDHYIYRDRWRDSIRVVRDSVAIETVKEVQVEKPLSWWQKLRMRAFWWLLGGLILTLGWIFRKPLLVILKKLLPI